MAVVLLETVILMLSLLIRCRSLRELTDITTTHRKKSVHSEFEKILWIAIFFPETPPPGISTYCIIGVFLSHDSACQDARIDQELCIEANSIHSIPLLLICVRACMAGQSESVVGYIQS